jgi:hypothetical protein
MKISSINQVYMKSQAKVVNEKQNDNVKVSTFQQNDFSPALLCSANMNKVSFGDNEKKDGLYCIYDEVPSNKGDEIQQPPRQKVTVDDYFDRDALGVQLVEENASKKQDPDAIFKDQVRQLCRSDIKKAENLANELSEQIYNANPKVAIRVINKSLERLYNEDADHFSEVIEKINSLRTQPHPQEACIRSHCDNC